MSRLLAAALRYATRWPVFPCLPGSKRPATTNGFHDATRDPQQIRAWWHAEPERNVAMPTGEASGVFVVDVDGEDGLAALTEFAGRVPATLTQATPSGGFHLLFCHHGQTPNTARKLGPQLDTRGDGGYVLLTPSRVNGCEYRWVTRGEPAAQPGWLLRLTRTPPPKGARTGPPTAEDGNLDGYVKAAVADECDQLSVMPPASGRNQRLNVAAGKLGQLVAVAALDSESVYDHLLAACEANGLLREDGERACRKTIASGLSWGMKHPREVSA